MTYTNRIVIENLDDLKEYHDSKHHVRVFEAMKSALDVLKNGGHYNDLIACFALNLSDINKAGVLQNIAELSSKVFADQCKFIINGKRIAINENFGYFPISDCAEVEFITNIIYTEADIKISKFDGGRHFYAFIKGIQVVDSQGEKKWNTNEFAYKQALKKLEQMNKN